jgi:hypothetical protein
MTDQEKANEDDLFEALASLNVASAILAILMHKDLISVKPGARRYFDDPLNLLEEKVSEGYRAMNRMDIRRREKA